MLTTLLLCIQLAACAPRVELVSGPVATALQAPAGAAAMDWSDWDLVLGRAVDRATGNVDYAAIQADPAPLARVLAALAVVDIAALAPAERKALLLNAYNVYTVRLITEQTPLPASIRDLDNPWKTRRWTLAGQVVSLDDIEHGLLRPLYRDPRVHFAVNCASRGCPPLRPTAFRGATLDAQLDAAVTEALARPDQLQVDGDVVRVTRLLDWYGADFTAEGWAPVAATKVAWLARYRAGIPEGATLRFLEYDWALNGR